MREDCSVELIPGFLSEQEARDLEQELSTTLDWEQRAIVLFGKPVLQPRLIAWAGALPYRYSGQTLEACDMVAPLLDAMDRVSDRVAIRFNHVLVNRYRDGRDSMGWHADDEPELGSEPQVATLSLGAPRRFLLKPRRGAERGERLSYVLTPGSLLVMRGATQRHYVHSVPKQTMSAGERISLTFRQVHTSPELGTMPGGRTSPVT